MVARERWLVGEKALEYAEQKGVDVVIADTMTTTPARVRRRLETLRSDEAQFLLNSVAVRKVATDAA